MHIIVMCSKNGGRFAKPAVSHPCISRIQTRIQKYKCTIGHSIANRFAQLYCCQACLDLDLDLDLEGRETGAKLVGEPRGGRGRFWRCLLFLDRLNASKKKEKAEEPYLEPQQEPFLKYYRKKEDSGVTHAGKAVHWWKLRWNRKLQLQVKHVQTATLLTPREAHGQMNEF